MAKPEAAYLGPEGTFSGMVTNERFGNDRTLVPMPTIDDVFDYVNQDPARVGVVPIENSSGGMIHRTVDLLLERENHLWIQEELSINVNLALAGISKQGIKKVYSHFVPFHHCDRWLKSTLPSIEREVVSSTAEAAQRAAKNPESAALCTRTAAEMNALEILEYPVEQDIQNITQFYCVGHTESDCTRAGKISLKMTLPNVPGALVDFLEPFKACEVNLTRILSRPIAGRPQEYVFLIDLSGRTQDPNIQKAIDFVDQRGLCVGLKILGCYPIGKTIDS